MIIVFDLSDKNSFTNIKDNWLLEVKKYCSDDVEIMIIGNKNDLTD